jgi:NDP-sugar pyrophosphorylase family protein
VELRFSYEQELLDTGGGIRRVVDFLRESDPAVVIGGDMLIDFPIQELLGNHRKTGAAISALLLEDPRAARFGTIGIDEEGRVRRIAERFRAPGGTETRCGLYTWVNVFSSDCYRWMPEQDRFSHFDAWWVPAIEAAPDAVRGLLLSPDKCRWEPVGTPAEYLRANLDPWKPSYFDAAQEATRRGVELSGDRVIGPGAVLAPGAEIERSVVWAGERVPAGRYRGGVFAAGRFVAIEEAGAGAAP